MSAFDPKRTLAEGWIASEPGDSSIHPYPRINWQWNTASRALSSALGGLEPSGTDARNTPSEPLQPASLGDAAQGRRHQHVRFPWPRRQEGLDSRVEVATLTGDDALLPSTGQIGGCRRSRESESSRLPVGTFFVDELASKHRLAARLKTAGDLPGRAISVVAQLDAARVNRMPVPDRMGPSAHMPDEPRFAIFAKRIVSQSVGRGHFLVFLRIAGVFLGVLVGEEIGVVLVPD